MAVGPDLNACLHLVFLQVSGDKFYRGTNTDYRFPATITD
jgi:hypothetical protein